MKKNFLLLSVLPFLFLLTACTSIYQDAQAEKIFTTYKKNRDPQNKLSSFKAIELTYENVNGDVKIIHTFKQPDKMLIEMVRKDESTPFLVYGMGNGILWEKTRNRPAEFIYDDGMKNSLKFFYDARMQPEKLIESVAYGDVEYIDNIRCDKLILTLKPQYSIRKVNIYISREDGMCIRSTYVPDPSTKTDWVSTYSDYKNFDGIMFPGTFTTDYNDSVSKFKLMNVELNKDVTDSVFVLKSE